MTLMVHALHRQGVGALIAAAILCLFSGGGYCYYSSDGTRYFYSGSRPPLSHPSMVSPVLESYRQVPANVPGRHPIAALRQIEGVSVAALGIEPGRQDDDDLRALADLVLDVNAGLIGVPPGAGTLMFDQVIASERGRTVRYLQLAPPSDGGTAIPGAGISLDFDDAGALSEIVNYTVVAVHR